MKRDIADEAPGSVPPGLPTRRHAVDGHEGVAALLLLLTLLAPPAAVAQERAAGAAYPQPPQAVFADLFVAVQSEGLYPDSKAFPDAVAREAPARILAQYHAAHLDSPAALERFVAEHFSLPAQITAAPSAPDHVPIATHIDRLWGVLTRSTPTAPPYASLLALPAPYVVPGGRFRELYYWDSYFTMLGLAQSGRHDLVSDMVRDFAYLIDTYGHVPNGTRTYYLSRSQPPFFFEMVSLLSDPDPGRALSRYLPQLEREYAFWMRGAKGLRRGSARERVVAMPDGSILNRYWDDRDSPRDESYREDRALAQASGRPAPQVYRDIRAAAESGWDFGSRWFADGRTRATIDTTQIVPVDLNSLLFGLESAIRLGCRRRADQACVREFAHRAAARRAAIDRYLWNPGTGAYLDYRWTQRAPVPRVSAATLYPLFVALSSPSQAAAVARTTLRVLLMPGGIVTTPLDTGEQWDAPNGWAPIQWIAIDGLRRYGQRALARTIADRWMDNVEAVYAQSGRLVEKYDVVTTGRSGGGGEYPLQDGFGWTNGVMRKLMVLYPASTATPKPAEKTGGGGGN
ncbi:MAG TPA: alpha,alpha-trehalase TreF [Steroidobacteraceae bacterium]